MTPADKSRIDALEAIVADCESSDPVVIRGARLKEIEREQRIWLSETSEALDLLLEALRVRARGIADGEVVRPAPDTKPELPAAEAVPVPPDEAPTREELPAVPLGEIAVDEVLDDATPPDIDRLTPAVEEAPPEVDTVAAAPVRREVDSEAPTILEMSMISDADIEAHLAEQAAEEKDQPPWVAAAEEHAQAEAEAMDAVTPGWTRRAELLFEDTLRLFRLGDSDGALISLERLLASIELNEDLQEFVRVNEDRLLQLYHAVLGPWTRVPRRVEPDGPTMPGAFYAVRKVAAVLERVDGRSSIETLMSHRDMSRLESVATLSQLVRSRAVILDPV